MLGNIQRRERYDRDTSRVRTQQTPRGSHSSAPGPFGARPASGLSRRRTHFKGPPPSFYRSGGWGTHGARRQAQAEGARSAARGTSPDSTNPGGGFGPGRGQSGFGNDVPHFDQEGHYRTQKSREDRWRSRARDEVYMYNATDANVLVRFLLITCIVGLCSAPIWVYGKGNNSPKRKETASEGQ